MLPINHHQRGYYDCRISRPNRRGMNWTETSFWRALRQMNQLLALPQARGKIGVIRFRARGQLGDIRTWHKLPLVLKIEPLRKKS